jgi:Tol biopolymer transport system component
MKTKLWPLLVILCIGCSKQPSGKIYINDDYQLLLFNYEKASVDTVVKNDGPDGLFYHDVIDDSICFNKIVGWPKTKKASWCFNMFLLHENVKDTLIYETTKWLDYIKFSPDGNRIAFKYRDYDNVANNFQTSSCAIYDLKTKQYKTILLRNLSDGGICWSMNGQMLFVATSEGTIITVDDKGNMLDQICSGYSPALSPNGLELAYTIKRSIFIINLATGQKKKVVSNTSLYIPQEPGCIDLAWSPDSRYLLYQGQNLLSFITGWSSQYIVVPVEGLKYPYLVTNITARGYGAVWTR